MWTPSLVYTYSVKYQTSILILHTFSSNNQTCIKIIFNIYQNT